MFDAFLQGLMLVFQWPAIGFVVLGTLLGIWLSAVPGLGGIIGIVILLPFTFSMDPVSAFALLLGLYAVTGQGDTITAIMMGVPGTVAGQATILDGYPLAKQGQASRAFGAAFFVSAAGGVIGSLLLAASLPLVQPVVLLFGAPEVFMLGVLGVVMVGSLSGKSLLNGLAAAMLGILFSTVGYAETVAVPRYWFGTTYLLENFPLVPAVLGFFAIPQLLELASRGETIARVTPGKDHAAQLWQGVTDVFKNWWLSLRCIAIGVYIGILPGLGPAMSDWMAYGHAVQSAKDKSKFGKGDIRGVIAPECATAATRPGDLIPTVAFGVPGSFACAILLGALLIQGLRPGPDMLGPKLPITFSMVWTMILANILAAGILMLWTRQVAKVAFINGHLIVPAVIAFVLMGSFLDGASYGDWITCIGMGLLGYWFQRAGWARPPFVLAFVLGPILETNFHISNRAYRWAQLARQADRAGAARHRGVHLDHDRARGHQVAPRGRRAGGDGGGHRRQPALLAAARRAAPRRVRDRRRHGAQMAAGGEGVPAGRLRARRNVRRLVRVARPRRGEGRDPARRIARRCGTRLGGAGDAVPRRRAGRVFGGGPDRVLPRRPDRRAGAVHGGLSVALGPLQLEDLPRLHGGGRRLHLGLLRQAAARPLARYVVVRLDARSHHSVRPE